MLYEKVHAFRNELLTLDWTKDKMMDAGSRAYGYVSVEKVKRNFGPLVAKHGLEMVLTFSDLQSREPMGMMSQHWTLKGTMDLVDVESGQSLSYTAYGEAGDSGDKGVNKAQTDALKQIVFTSFMVGEDAVSDPDAVTVHTISSPRGCFVPKIKANEEEVKSQIKARAVPVPKPGSVPAPVSKGTPKTPKIAPKIVPKAPKVAPKVPEVKKKTAPAPKPASVPMAEEPEAVELPKVYQSAIKTLLKEVGVGVQFGQISEESAKAIEQEAKNIKSLDDAKAFIKEHQK